MSRTKGLPTAASVLYAIFITFICLSCCGGIPSTFFNGLRMAEVPIYLPELKPTTSTQNYKIALNLGIAGCDALACIYKEDRAALPRYKGLVYDYAKKLGTSEKVLQQLDEITTAMNRGYLPGVLDLSEKFGNKVLEEFEKAGKKDESNLAAVAFYLEQVSITAESVNRQFSPESAKLLRIAGLVKQLEEWLQSISVDLKDKEDVKAIMAALPKIDQIINKPEDYTYTQSDIQALVKICEPLRQTLLSD